MKRRSRVLTRFRTRAAKFLNENLGTEIETEPMRRGRLAHDRGMRAEDRVANALEKKNWLVKRSPGSRGLHDIEAFRSGERLFGQVKSGGAWPSTDETVSLAKRAARKGASAAIFHEHRGCIDIHPVCRWCGKAGRPGQESCANCGQPF